MIIVSITLGTLIGATSGNVRQIAEAFVVNGKEQTMLYRLDYFMYGKWITWGFYEDADEAQDDAFEHQRVYGSEDVRVVPVPKYLC